MVAALALAKEHVGNDRRRRIANKNDNAAPLFGNDPHGLLQKVRAWPRGAKNIVEHVDRMHPHQYRFGTRNIALHQRDMFGIFDRVQIDHQLEFATEVAVEFRFDGTMDEVVVAAAIGNKIGNRRDLETMELCELHEIGKARHRTVVVHDLADDTSGIKPRKTRYVDRRFRMPGAHQHATVSRDEREHMSRRHDIRRALRGIDRHRHRMRAVMCRDARRDTLARLDRHGEGCLMTRLVRRRHELQVELLRAFARQRETNQATPVFRHEIDGFRRAHLCRNNEVAFVLALLRIDENEHLAVARVLDDVLDGGKVFLVHGSQSF